MAIANNRMLMAGGHSTYLNLSGENNGEAVLFLHGSGPGATAWSNWQFALPLLGDTFSCIAPDFVGFGKSEHPEVPPQGVAAWRKLWTEQIFGLLDELKLNRVHLVGNSLGGGIALYLLTEQPERFDKVVLMGPCGAPFQCTRELDQIWGFYDNPTPSSMAQLISWFAFDEGFMGDDFRKIAQMRFQAAMDAGVRRSFAAMFPAPRQSSVNELVIAPSALKRMKNSMLLIHGRDDRIVPLDTSYYLVQHLGGPVQMHIYGRCSHWTQIEFRDSFNRLLLDFFQGAV